MVSILLLLLSLFSFEYPPKPDFRTPYEKSNRTRTTTYAECIAYYQRLDEAFPEVQVRAYGSTDAGLPLHVVVVSLDRDFDPASLRRKSKRIFLIQNGIHPGEPEGIDASMMLARDYLQQKKLRPLLEKTVLVIIPIYNVGGALTRNSFSRTNQNGPESYGFRGNARNLDLNRDYLKNDSRNARTFAQIFHEWQPDVFTDNHTSNGADYQHTMTLIATQPNKLNRHLSAYLTQQMLPALYAGMKERKLEMVPYMNTRGETPEAGIEGFLETPRYSTGYTTLFNTIGFVPETHMLKPFPDRVRATYALMEVMLRTIHRDADKIGEARARAVQDVQQQQDFPLTWRLDTTQVEQIRFSGYEARYKPSEVSGLPRLYYDRKAPYTRSIPYYNTFRPAVTVRKPVAYVIPQAWQEVIGLLELNQVRLHRLAQDTTLTAEAYYIDDFKTVPSPYEGHYLHYGVQLRRQQQQLPFRAGDYVVYVDQPTNRYIVETLEPQAVDSFFNWGFFDSILQQKEYFSAYVFEDLAAELLRQDPALRAKLEDQKQQDQKFAQNPQAQLDFVYRNSPYYEPSHRRYPVVRLNEAVKLPVR
ncbi:M14 family metallopeptidase [soil metagenome]